MKKIIPIIGVLLCLLPQFSWGQTVLTVYPTQNKTGFAFTSLAASASTTQTFNFGGARLRNPYSGYVEVVVEIDSASGTVGDRDSLTISIQPLFAIKTGVETFALRTSGHADKDSISILDDYDWGTTDDDTKIDINLTANLPVCDGAQANIYTGINAQCVFRISLRTAVDRGF